MTPGKPTRVEELSFPARLTFSKEYTASTMRMKFSDTTVFVTDDDGNDVGRVSGCIGGGVEISDTIRGETWFIDGRDIWNQFQLQVGDPDRVENFQR